MICEKSCQYSKKKLKKLILPKRLELKLCGEYIRSIYIFSQAMKRHERITVMVYIYIHYTCTYLYVRLYRCNIIWMKKLISKYQK